MYPYQIGLSSGVLAILEQAEKSRDRMRLVMEGRKDDRREKQEAIEFADRRKGPRRWLEKRNLEAGNSEKD